MSEAKLRFLAPGPHPYSRCAIRGCTDPVIFAAESPMKKRHTGLRRMRCLCQNHGEQFAEQHNIPVPQRA